MGGAGMARTRAEGVCDGKNRVFGYTNMYICDGSMLGANLGVNPSLTITAMAEHIMSQVPPKPGAAQRPAVVPPRQVGHFATHDA